MAPDHHRCHKTHVPQTRSERIAKSVRFFPHEVSLSQPDKVDDVHSAALRLVATLKAPAIDPFFQDKNNRSATLNKLADIFLTRCDGSSNDHKTTLSLPIKNASPHLTETAPSPRVINPPSPRL